MAITLRYNPAYANTMGVAQDTGEGDLLRQLNEIARRDQMEAARLDEQARQFDLGLAANQQNQASQRGFQYASLGANVAQNQAAMQQRAMEQQSLIDARMAEQQMQGEQVLAGQQMQNQRAFVGEQARVAREAANRRFEKSMKDREVLLDQFQRGMLTPQQEQQAIASWEEAAQMDWGMPDEMANQEAGQADQQRVAQLESSFFTDPINGGSLIEPGAVQSMLEFGMDPKDIAALGVKMQGEARQRAQLQAKEGEADRKLEEQAAKDQQKEEAAAAKEATKTMRDSIAGEREWRQAQEEYSRDLQDYDEKMASYEAAKSAHAKMSAGGRGGTGATPRPFTQTPPQKPVPPTPGLFADKIPTPRSPEERDRLLPGTRYIDPAGNVRVRQ